MDAGSSEAPHTTAEIPAREVSMKSDRGHTIKNSILLAYLK